MAEALGLASSIVALVQLSASVYSATSKFYRQAKEAKSDISALATQTRNLSGVLQSLSLLASAPLFDDVGAAVPDFRDTYVESCRTTLHTLKRKLEIAEADFDSGSKKRLIRRSLKWPFDSQETTDLISELSQHQNVLQLALSAETMSHLLQCLANTNSIAKSIDGLRRKLDRKASIDTRAELTARREEIVRFFLKVNPEQHFQDCRNLRQENTGRWLTERDQTFRDWIDSTGSQIWLSGIPGAGKTILCGTVVEEILQEQTLSTAVAFFFCDYKLPESQKPDNILAALAVQLAKQADSAFELLESYYEELHPHNRIARPPDTKDMIGIVQAMIERYDRVYLVVDGLDECGSNVVEVLQALKKLARYRQVNMALFSRNEPEIMEELANSQRIEIAAHTEDLELYVLAQMGARKKLGNLAVRKPELHEYIRRTLVEGANGMFRWVACQLDYLDSLPSDGRRRKALSELPPTLFETYDRILDRIMQEDERDQELCRKALHWIGLGYENIDPLALCEAISIPDDQDLVDEELVVDPDWITRSCSSLIRMTSQEFDSPHFEFAHFTVKEYLRSIKPGSKRSLFQFAEDVATQELLGSALRFLTFPVFDRRPRIASSELQQLAERNEQHPFYPIAASYMFSSALGNLHQPFLGHDISLLLENDTMMEYARKLFSPHKTGTFLSWILQVLWSWPHADLGEDDFSNILGLLLAPEFTTLHVAAIFACPSICIHLIDNKVNLNVSCRVGTPLHALLAGPALLFPPYRFKYNPELHFRILPTSARYKEARICLEVFLEHGADTSIRWNTTSVVQMAINCVARVRVETGWIRPLIAPSTIVPEDCIQFARHQVALGDIDDSILDAIVTLGSTTDIANGWARLASLVQTSRMQQGHCVTRNLPFDDQVRILDEDFADGIRISLSQGSIGNLTYFLQDQRFRPEMLITSSDSRSIPLLHFAIREGSLRSVAMLLEAGCNPQGVDEDNGCTALHQCAFADTDGAAITSLLLESGVADSVKNDLGKTCWHIAAEAGNVSVLKVLIDMGVDTKLSLTTTSNEGKTPLASAIHGKRLQAALLLLEYSCADVMCFQRDQSLLDNAASVGSKDLFLRVYDKLREVEATEAIDNSKPLFHITMSCSQELLDYLLGSWPMSSTESSIALTRFLLRASKDILQTPEDEYPSRESLGYIIYGFLRREDDSVDHDNIQNLYWKTFCEEVVPYFTNGDNCSYGTCGCHAGLIDAIFDIFIGNKALASYEQILQLPGYNIFFRALLRRDGFLKCRWIAPSVHKVAQASGLSGNLSSDEVCIKLLSSAVRNSSSSYDNELVRELLNCNVDIHAVHGSLSPLEQVCRGSVPSMFQLIMSHSDKKLLNRTGSEGKTPLHWAVSGWGSLENTEHLLRLGVNVEAVVDDPTEDTALTLASRTYREDVVALLVSWGANSLYRARDGWTILHAAAISGDLRLIQSLTPSKTPMTFWQGVRDMYVGRFGSHVKNATVIHLAAANGKAAFLDHLIQMQVPFDVNAVAGYAIITPMHLAAEFGHLDVLEILISLKANVDGRDAHGLLPIDLALRNSHFEVVKALFKSGSKPSFGISADLFAHLISNQTECVEDAGDSTDMSQFYFENAILHGDLELCKKMVDKGQSINSAFQSSSYTPLVLAVVNGQTRIVDWLISAGVEVGNPVNQWLSPTLRCTASLITHYIPSTKILSAFLNLALNQNVTWYGSVLGPLHVAILDNKMEALEAILRHIRENEHAYRHLLDTEFISRPADTRWPNCSVLSVLVNQFNREEAFSGRSPWPRHRYKSPGSPLHWAIRVDNLSAVKLLLQNEADVNQAHSRGRSPLLLAVRKQSSPAIIRELLHAGAGPSGRVAAMRVATRRGDMEVIKILTEADPETLWATDHFLVSGLMPHAGSVEAVAYLLSRGLKPSNHESIGFSGVTIQMTDFDLTGFMVNSGLLSHLTDGLIAEVFASALDDSNFLLIKWLYRTVRCGLFSSLVNITRPGWASPLCVAASRDAIDQAENLIKMGAEIDLDGCVYGSPLMAACALGNLDVARCLVRSGASLSYVNQDGMPRSAFSLSSRHQKVMRWLLIGRHLEQPKLEYQDSQDTSHQATWSGPRLFKLVLPAYMRRDFNESRWNHLCRLQKWKDDLLGSSLSESRRNSGLDFDAELLAESRKSDAQAAHRQFLARLGEH